MWPIVTIKPAPIMTCINTPPQRMWQLPLLGELVVIQDHLNFTNFDDKNAIVANAGFTSFTVAITGTDHTYTGNSTTSLQNDWLGGASVAGALYGDTSPDESGGRINVNLYKSGDIGTAGANDFYMAEGIYLID